MITDSFLNEVAKAIGNESYNVPAYLAVGTADVSIVAGSDTSISGEISPRISLDKTGSANYREFSAIRSGSDVLDTTNGDDIETVGIFNTATQATSDPLLTGVVINGVTQTTAFDVEFVVNIEVNRR